MEKCTPMRPDSDWQSSDSGKYPVMLCVSYLQTPQNIRVGDRLPCVQTLAGRVQRVGNIHVDLAQEDVLKFIVDEKFKNSRWKCSYQKMEG